MPNSSSGRVPKRSESTHLYESTHPRRFGIFGAARRHSPSIAFDGPPGTMRSTPASTPSSRSSKRTFVAISNTPGLTWRLGKIKAVTPSWLHALRRGPGTCVRGPIPSRTIRADSHPKRRGHLAGPRSCPPRAEKSLRQRCTRRRGPRSVGGSRRRPGGRLPGRTHLPSGRGSRRRPPPHRRPRGGDPSLRPQDVPRRRGSLTGPSMPAPVLCARWRWRRPARSPPPRRPPAARPGAPCGSGCSPPCAG